MGARASKSVPTIQQGNCSIEIRMMLIGKTGAGKSTLGDAILDKKTFSIEGHPMVTTSVSCDTGRATIGDKDIVILDTPGVMGTNQDEEQIMKELFKGTSSLFPGPHVFLLVIRADAKFNKEETKAVEIFSNLFGEAMCKYLIVVFTHKSTLDKRNKTVEDCLRKLPETFQQFKECCIAIDTGSKPKRVKKSVAKLLQLVEMVIKRNNFGFYPDEKIKEIGKEYMARIEAENGLRAKGKKQVEKIAGIIYDKAADTVEDVTVKVTETFGAAVGKVQTWLH